MLGPAPMGRTGGWEAVAILPAPARPASYRPTPPPTLSPIDSVKPEKGIGKGLCGAGW